MNRMQNLSPFLDPGPVSQANALAVLHLKRDLLLPTKLQEKDEHNEGYDEGRVTNTRFGSFPHSTLIGLPWGSQVRASAVDTGSRGRRGFKGKKQNEKKRKRDEDAGQADRPGNEDSAETPTTLKAAVAASTGFIHLLPPTPESWTASLPHRTQVVYTPDYSYILHRLRVRPGSVILEAGAGSGSFSHAAARAVFSGHPEVGAAPCEGRLSKKRRVGKVWSYEFHEQRVQKLKSEIEEHGLDGIVHITHRDVCDEGFLLSPNDGSLNGEGRDKRSADAEPQADAIFLDLPAPWLALRHLTRRPLSTNRMSTDMDTPNSDLPAVHESTGVDSSPINMEVPGSTKSMESEHTHKQLATPLNPKATISICTFSPCIEQVQRTISTLRQLGWLEIDMVEVAHKRIEVRRERVGLQEEGLRGANPAPATVEEAVERLKEVESHFRTFHNGDISEEAQQAGENLVESNGSALTPVVPNHKQTRLGNIREALVERKLYKEGRLIHRVEPELKTHTSYLVFAILPREWTPEEEEKSRQRWPVRTKLSDIKQGETMSKRQLKKAAKASRPNNGGVTPTAPRGREVINPETPYSPDFIDSKDT
ncbi:MAG: tRNA (adenine-N(1)-)-methyltransferase catalytic subunit trm61 [Pycnora praestabilis]|nr:MAG: tRNA (adenine-N(1)-)-methyltransferase catalytic subunit trm61 [Pycnora praestabilis]